MRTACCSVGIVLPVYSTFKAIERKDEQDQQKWLLYWAAYGSFSLVEVFSDKILSWFPPYYYLKFAFLVWLQLPNGDGARQLYMNHIRPFLLKHQSRVDQVMGFAYVEMAKFISAHQAEIQYARTMLVRIMAPDKTSRGTSNPAQPRGQDAIEGQTRVTSDSESDHDD